MTNKSESSDDEASDNKIDGPQSNFGSIHHENIQKLSSLEEITPILLLMTSAAGKAIHSEKAKFLDEFGELTKEEGNTKSYTIDFNHISKLRYLDKREKYSETTHEYIPNTLLVSLVSQFDAFLGELLKEIFNLVPGR